MSLHPLMEFTNLFIWEDTFFHDERKQKNNFWRYGVYYSLLGKYNWSTFISMETWRLSSMASWARPTLCPLISTVLDHISLLKQEFQSIYFHHIYQETNIVEYGLSKLGLRASLGVIRYNITEDGSIREEDLLPLKWLGFISFTLYNHMRLFGYII